MYDINALLEQIESLTQERDYWKEQVLGKKDQQIKSILKTALNLTRAELHIIAFLYSQHPNIVKRIDIESNLPGKSIHDIAHERLIYVLICRIRKRYGKTAIITHIRLGLTLGPEFYTHINQIITEGMSVPDQICIEETV